ncbi:MAG: ABC transporter permease subunit [Bacillota bacterium]
MTLSRGLLGKELREGRWKWMIGGGALLLTALSLPFGFEFLSSLFAAAPPLPEPWGTAISRQMSDYTTYLWLNWYGKNLFQLVVVIAAILGAAPLAGEKSRQSMEFLLAQPVSRAAIFRTKYLAGLALLWGVIVVSTLSMGPSSAMIEHSLNLPSFLRGLPVTLAAAALFYSIAWVYSALFSEQLKAALAAGATSTGLIALGWIPALKQFSLGTYLAATHTLQTGEIRWDVTLLLLGLSLLCAAAAWRIFRSQKTLT